MKRVVVFMVACCFFGCNKRTAIVDELNGDRGLAQCRAHEMDDTSLHFQCEFTGIHYATNGTAHVRRILEITLNQKCGEIKAAGFRSIMVEGRFSRRNGPSDMFTVDAERLAAGDCTLRP